MIIGVKLIDLVVELAEAVEDYYDKPLVLNKGLSLILPEATIITFDFRFLEMV